MRNLLLWSVSVCGDPAGGAEREGHPVHNPMLAGPRRQRRDVLAGRVHGWQQGAASQAARVGGAQHRQPRAADHLAAGGPEPAKGLRR